MNLKLEFIYTHFQLTSFVVFKKPFYIYNFLE